ncbi:hypothetical protein HLB23_22280 [Nocardia uniformis]|uniref:Uncharacterized protein n=2 Tax=Nocardia uniformis TaxID=53432 RepID=A0A849C1C7_9NOCA|nr:hypothetical protein [Nocardia uniformis]
MLVQLMFVLMMATALVLAIGYFWRGRNPFSGRGEQESGTLYVTGISPRPEALDDQYVTITGNISGPSLVAYEAYGRFVWDVNRWPYVGEQIPVLYPSGKPQHWFPDHPGARRGTGSPFHG